MISDSSLIPFVSINSPWAVQWECLMPIWLPWISVCLGLECSGNVCQTVWWSGSPPKDLFSLRKEPMKACWWSQGPFMSGGVAPAPRPTQQALTTWADRKAFALITCSSLANVTSALWSHMRSDCSSRTPLPQALISLCTLTEVLDLS